MDGRDGGGSPLNWKSSPFQGDDPAAAADARGAALQRSQGATQVCTAAHIHGLAHVDSAVGTEII